MKPKPFPIKKRIHIIFILILIISIIIGLGIADIFFDFSSSSYFSYRSIETSNSTSWTMRYHTLDGTISHKINLHNDNNTVITINGSTTKGDIEILYKDEEDNEHSLLTHFDDCTQKYTLPKAGKYTLIIKANNHQGHFNISWD